MKLFDSNSERGPDYEALISTECPECFIRVTGFRTEVKGRIDYEVFLSLFSSHDNRTASFKWRLTRAWRVFRGKPDPDYEILTEEVLVNLIAALTECHGKVFKAETEDPRN